ncbi:MAG: hypothetical protein K6F01_13075 [Selenomonas sp.]|uniref:hypothetical protein n=1 Tax=Selenomonas sp. TaxID=2053611 RepID=UPI0025CD4778|nr:hypothetical protein [Selenomonas sp.]MCR5440346.1 hypothetical protein [Selenomonas sp.]
MSWEHGKLQKDLDELYSEIEINGLLKKSVVSRMTVEGQENIESLINKRIDIIDVAHVLEGQIVDMMRHLKDKRDDWSERLENLKNIIKELESARYNDIALLKNNAISFMENTDKFMK